MKTKNVYTIIFVSVFILIIIILLFLGFFQNKVSTVEKESQTIVNYEIQRIADLIKIQFIEESNIDVIGELLACKAYFDDISICDQIKSEDARSYCITKVQIINDINNIQNGNCELVSSNEELNLHNICIGLRNNDCESLFENEKFICDILSQNSIEVCENYSDKAACRQAIMIANALNNNPDMCYNEDNFIEQRTCLSLFSQDCTFQDKNIYTDLALIQIIKFDEEDITHLCENVEDPHLKTLCFSDMDYPDIILNIKTLTYSLV